MIQYKYNDSQDVDPFFDRQLEDFLYGKADSVALVQKPNFKLPVPYPIGFVPTSLEDFDESDALRDFEDERIEDERL